MNNKEYLDRLFKSDKPLIIYKARNGYDVYTDFSDKIKIQHYTIKDFLKKVTYSKKNKNNFFDGYIGFFGYELCCELIGVKVPRQKNNRFPKSIFYKPQTVIKIRKNIIIKSILPNFRYLKDLKKANKKFFYEKSFNVNLSLKQYSKLFKKFFIIYLFF